MRGIGDVLSVPLDLPPLAAVLANPGAALSTADVFARLGLARGEAMRRHDAATVPAGRGALLQFLGRQENDLEGPATALQPVIAEVLDALRAFPGCGLCRMSGSGATCFALFASRRAAAAAARSLTQRFPAWWVRATRFG
jgi:4-diphosphocytidyl-2-C-methyl-D-erythritol kinase